MKILIDEEVVTQALEWLQYGSIAHTALRSALDTINSIMKYNSETGDLIVFAPTGSEVFRTVEPDFKKAQDLTKAIHESYDRGFRNGAESVQHAVDSYILKL